jgi:tetratricopeptide (TPR) repeat protein
MKTRLISLLSGIFCSVSILTAQVPSAQLKIKENSGFLGMGGPRIVKVELSNQKILQPLNSDNVNSGDYFYFLISPAGDWQIKPDFVKEELSKIYILQNGNKIPLAWKGDLTAEGNGSILFGFTKTVKLNLPFSFQYPTDEAINQADLKVPLELWPGYATIISLAKDAEAAASLLQFRSSIGLYEQILGDTSLQIFPQYNEIKKKRTQCFDGFYNQTYLSFQSASASQIDIRSRISLISDFRPAIKFIIDSLPRAEWAISPLDTAIAPIIFKSRNSLAAITNFRDSLQHILDDQVVQWIIDGSASGKNGFLYSYIIETFASAYSSLNYADTIVTELKVKIPEEYQGRLKKFELVESYETFIRISNERYQMHLPIFPVNFLPNLRKDTASFSLPYYSMLKAVNDFYYGNYPSAKKEILNIFRTCYDLETNSRFDLMRVAIENRRQNISPEVMKLLDEAEQFERARDIQNAQDKYRQATLIAPNFAYGFFALGKFYGRTGDPIRANYSFQRASQIDTLYLSAFRESYSIFLKQSNFKEIINVLSTALSKGNDYWEINYNLGVAFLGEAEPARAIQSFERALALSPKSYKTNIQLGLAHQNVKNYQKAREFFNNAIGLDPTRQEAVDYLTKLNELQRAGK